MARGRKGIIAVSVAASLVARLAAGAPTPSELAAARELFAKAERDEEQFQFEAALEKLRRVATVKETAGIRFHLAFCEEKLDRRVAALADYTSAEALALRENNTEVLDALKEPLARLRALVPKLTLRLAKGATETARDVVVSIDGAPLATGLVGTPIPVEAGRHRVEAQAKNRVPFVLEVVLRDRESAAFDIVLENAASSLETRAESGAHARAATSLRPWGIAAAGGAVALGAFGVVSYVVAGNAVDSGRVECTTDSSRCSSARASVRAWDAIALGAWVGATAALGTSIVLFTRPSPAMPGSQGWARSSRARIGLGRVVVEGEF